jgi:hypothetical protein
VTTEQTPIPMRLECPACGELHIDVGEFATKPHHTHACQSCGAVWRPAVVPTVGVRFLPGFKNDLVEQSAEWWKAAHDRLYLTAVKRVKERDEARAILTEMVHFARTFGCNRTKDGPCACCDAIKRAEALLSSITEDTSA